MQATVNNPAASTGGENFWLSDGKAMEREPYAPSAGHASRFLCMADLCYQTGIKPLSRPQPELP